MSLPEEVPAVEQPTADASAAAETGFSGLQTAAEHVNDQAGPSPMPIPPENPANTVPSRTLWMGDIEPWWDETFIVELWAQMGHNVEVKVIKPRSSLLRHQLAKASPHNQDITHSGYCFVEFESPQEAQECLMLNGSPIAQHENKTFRLNWASAATLDSEIAQTPEFSLFVGDLSPVTTEAHLLALFQTNFKSVKTVRVMTNPATGLSRCFGFVRFSNDDDRQLALIEMNGKWLGGRQIRVALATPKHHQQQQPQHQQQHLQQHPQHQQRSPPYYAKNQPNQMYYLGSPQQQHQQLLQQPSLLGGGNEPQGFNDPTNTTVFVGGLANGIQDDTLATLFEPFGEIMNIKVPQGKGCGFVKFIDRESAESAIQNMQGFVIGGSRIRLSWGRSNNQRQNQNRGFPLQLGSSPPNVYHSQHHPQNLIPSLAPQLPNHGLGPNAGMFDYQQQNVQHQQPPPQANQPFIYDPYFNSMLNTPPNSMDQLNHALEMTHLDLPMHMMGMPPPPMGMPMGMPLPPGGPMSPQFSMVPLNGPPHSGPAPPSQQQNQSGEYYGGDDDNAERHEEEGEKREELQEKVIEKEHNENEGVENADE